MKKNKIILLILMTLIFICGCNKENKTETQEESLYFKNYEVETFATINNCSTQDCPVTQRTTIVEIKASTNIDKIQEAIDSLNAEQQTYYQKAKDSLLSKGKTCGKYTKDVNYGYGILGGYYKYEDEKIISFGSQITEMDFCNDTTTSHQITYYIYDVEQNKMLTQEEYLNKVGILLTDVVNNINAEINLNGGTQTVTEQDDIVVYRTDWGEYNASYFDESMNEYNSIILGEGAD